MISSICRTALALAVTSAASAPAGAVTLYQNDLVALGDQGIVRIDGTTGAQEIISPVGGSDVAVAYGGRTLYAVGGTTLRAIDVATGTEQVLFDGFVSARGVSVNTRGDVFVLDGNTPSDTSPEGSPRLYRLDAGGSENPTLLFESTLARFNGPEHPVGWSAMDLEHAGDDLLLVLGRGSPFGCCGASGVVAFDTDLDVETILFDSISTSVGGSSNMFAETTLGVDALGNAFVAGEGSFATDAFYYDFSIDVALDIGALWSVADDAGDSLAIFYTMGDVTGTADGRMFASTDSGFLTDDSGNGAPDSLRGIYEVTITECATCPTGYSYRTQTTNDAPFSQGWFHELQPVVIPEPSTIILVGFGLGVLGLRRRGG